MTTSTGTHTIGRQMPRGAAGAIGALRWPFTHRYAAPLWLALRLYLAWIWFGMGWGKIAAGWLTNDALLPLFRSIANGRLAVPFAFFRDFAAFMVDTGLTAYLSKAMPFLELAVALSFVTGVLVVPAAVGGVLLVVNIILSGIGTLAFDGRIILLHVLLVLAWRVSGLIGLEALLLRLMRRAMDRMRTTPAPGEAPGAIRR
jgi:uncharacterized membrane protein YphA (DoxX/SURF4 family)